MSFDKYDTTTGTPPSSSFGGRFAVRGNIDGLEADAKAMLSVNGGEPRAYPNGAFALEQSVLDGSEYIIVAVEAGHVCAADYPSSRRVAGSDVHVDVHCLATNATLDSLSMEAPAFLRRDFQKTRAEVSYPISVPLVTALAHDPIRLLVTTTSPSATMKVGGVNVVSGVATDVPFAFAGLELTVTARAGDRYQTVAKLVPGWPTYFKAATPQHLASFGTGLAIGDDTLVVGAPGAQTTGQPGRVYVFRRTKNSWAPDAELSASNARNDARFGESVSLSGDTLVVGSPGESSASTGVDGNESDVTGLGAGAAYVFRRTASAWTKEAYLKPSNTHQFQQFGGSVAIDGDVVVVGSSAESSAGTGVNGDQAETTARYGAAYVFRRSGSKWAQEAYLKASNTKAAGFAGQLFGISVALSGDTVVVGASAEQSGSPGVNGDQADKSEVSAGAAYVFRRNAAIWAQEAYLKASRPRLSAFFGTSVAASNDTVVVSAFQESSGSPGVNANPDDATMQGAGAVYVFQRSGTTWVQDAYVKASNPRPNALFGCSVALERNALVVGARAEASGATGINGDQTLPAVRLDKQGAVYVFHRGASWKPLAYLKPFTTETGVSFGRSVAVSPKQMIAVGVPVDNSGAAGVFPPDADAGSPALQAGSGAAYQY